jgi:hypothetical protein
MMRGADVHTNAFACSGGSCLVELLSPLLSAAVRRRTLSTTIRYPPPRLVAMYTKCASLAAALSAAIWSFFIVHEGVLRVVVFEDRSTHKRASEQPPRKVFDKHARAHTTTQTTIATTTTPAAKHHKALAPPPSLLLLPLLPCFSH